MYKTLLILKYLRKRRIAWVSLVAVMMCTTMVIVVMSVMSGWLTMFRESARGLTGDVVIQRKSWTGFPKYDEIIQKLEAMPQVEAAVPTIETYGLVNVRDSIRSGVQVMGIPLDKIGKVNQFPQSLYRQHNAVDDPNLDAETKEDIHAIKTTQPSWDLPLPPEVYRSRFPKPKSEEGKKHVPDAAAFPGMIVGSGVIGIQPDMNGKIDYRMDVAVRAWAQLTVLGVNDLDAKQLSNVTPSNYWIVDVSRTKVYEQDRNTVYVPFDLLQKDLQMAADEYTDVKTGKKVIEPARTHTIQIKLKPGVDINATVPKIQQVVDAVLGQTPDDFDYVKANSWEQLRADFINAVEHEIVLLTILFGIISVVAVFLIFCIFYMIVAEKTRDIGIIKSVGASGGGVASIFLGYGFAIGILGGGLGLLVSYLIVHNINELHTWMGRHMGVEVFNAKTYMFDRIPDKLDPLKVSIIVAVAIVSSVVGSIIPAWRAARMNPVEALRWE